MAGNSPCLEFVGCFLFVIWVVLTLGLHSSSESLTCFGAATCCNSSLLEL